MIRAYCIKNIQSIYDINIVYVYSIHLNTFGMPKYIGLSN